MKYQYGNFKRKYPHINHFKKVPWEEDCYEIHGKKGWVLCHSEYTEFNSLIENSPRMFNELSSNLRVVENILHNKKNIPKNVLLWLSLMRSSITETLDKVNP